MIDTAADLIIHDTASDDATYLVSVFHSLEDTVFQQAITDTTLTITELAPNTDYTVHVLKRCADGMEHAMVSATFHTPSASCLPVTELPWSETFDDCSTYVPDCWTALNMNSGNVCVVTGEILPDPNEHTLIAYGAHAPEMLLLLPELALPMDSLLLSFDMMRYLYVDTIAGVEVGIVTDTADVSTFMPMATCIPNGDMVWERFQVTVPQVTSSRIALRFIIFDGPTYSAVIYVDNFTVEELSILPAPTNLQMLSVDSLTATVAWNAGGSESQWQLELTAPDTQTFSPSSNPTFTFTGLAPMTHYTVRVAAVDDDGTMSGWSLPLEFTTLDTTHTEGIACIEGNVDVTLYPNPAHTSVRVGVAEAADVTIIDMNGRTISTFRIHHSRHTVELESMARGTYMLRVVTAHGVAVRKLLVE